MYTSRKSKEDDKKMHKLLSKEEELLCASLTQEIKKLDSTVVKVYAWMSSEMNYGIYFNDNNNSEYIVGKAIFNRFKDNKENLYCLMKRMDEITVHGSIDISKTDSLATFVPKILYVGSSYLTEEEYINYVSLLVQYCFDKYHEKIKLRPFTLFHDICLDRIQKEREQQERIVTELLELCYESLVKKYMKQKTNKK